MFTPAGFTPAHAMPAALPATTLVFAFRGEKILVGGDEKAPRILTHREFAATGLHGPCHYLGEYQGVHCVASTLADDAGEVEGLRYAGLRSLFFVVPEPLVAIAARAFQVIEWDRTHRFCGRCGTPTRDKPGERAKECRSCGYVAYPRVSPAMMALVTRGRESPACARASLSARACTVRSPVSSSPAKRSRTASFARCGRKSASR